MATETEIYLNLIRRHLPDFAFKRAEGLQSFGQFNTVLAVDNRWIFRFPKSAAAAADLARELEMLPRLAGRLPLPIPDPRYWAYDDAGGDLLFMAYRLLPGQPLLREAFAKLKDDEAVLESIASDLALFLQTLHAIAPAELGLAPGGDAQAEWARIGEETRDKLFPLMRPEAREAIARDFEMTLKEADLWRYDECLTHGDFGTGNLLYQDGRVSGIIDFGFCGLGDPAQDLGALIASYGEPFAERVCRHYSALRAGLARARFYRRHYALIQALYALRDGDQAEFEDGMRDYV